MSRYIDGDLLMEYWDTFTWVDRHGMNREFAYIPARVVENALKFAADVKPVVHAHWIENDEFPVYNCSNCCDVVPWNEDYKYCPHCGAIMDEEENNG